MSGYHFRVSFRWMMLGWGRGRGGPWIQPLRCPPAVLLACGAGDSLRLLAPGLMFWETECKPALTHTRGIYLCGHSAGAHLAAMMLLVNWTKHGATPNLKGFHGCLGLPGCSPLPLGPVCFFSAPCSDLTPWPWSLGWPRRARLVPHETWSGWGDGPTCPWPFDCFSSQAFSW